MRRRAGEQVGRTRPRTRHREGRGGHPDHKGEAGWVPLATPGSRSHNADAPAHIGPTIEKAKETTGAATQKAKEATGTASQKANQVSGGPCNQSRRTLPSHGEHVQTAAGAREGARDFKQDVQKEARK